MKQIQYNYKQNKKTTVDGARKALFQVFESVGTPSSLLDVGCGSGVWLRVALSLGVEHVYGIDGVELPASEFMIDKARFNRIDLETHWDLNRRFDLAICLEVAEHLSEASAGVLVEALTAHANTVCFSAACPWQGGQHHVNLQWPAYW